MKTINSFRSKLFALTLALMASVSTFASDDHSRFLCCTILTDSTVAITGQSEYKTVPRYEYLPENLVIPAEVTLQGKTYKVVSIDQWAFYACTMLKSVIIPHTVTFIGMSAFHYCENLVEVYIPSSVKVVEGSAFAYTKWFDNLPDGEVYINNTLYRYKGTAPENTKIVVKDGTTRIAGLTFWNQSNIVSIELPQSLTVIEQCAFEGCTQLSSILIPKNVIFIGANAFADCTGLSTMTCIAPTPPTMGQFANPSANSEIFARVDVSNATLYVPAESVDAYKNADQWKDFGQILPIEQTPEDLFPTLWGLRRTHTIEMYDYAPNDGKRSGGYPLSFAPVKDTIINGKTYLQFSDKLHELDYSLFFLREENNKVLIYSSILQDDLVLYDYTLEVGDSLYTIEGYDWFDDVNITKLKKTKDAYVVTDVSTITLSDGIERKKWSLYKGYTPLEYVEGIGCFGENLLSWSGDFFRLITNYPYIAESVGDHLVCVSKNGQLLYSMTKDEMNSFTWTCECLSEKDTTYYKSKWCDTWNMLVRTGSIYPPSSTPYRYQLAKDTVIGEHTYTAVVQKEINDALDAPHYVAAVRFTDDRKVYIYYDNAEYLLYDFNVQEGDELEVFAGINNYTSEIKTYKCTVTDVEQYACAGCPAAITLEVHNHPNDFREFYRETQWIEGVGDINGFLNGINHYVEMDGGGSEYLLCAYKSDELKYTGDLYEEYGCGDDAEQSPEDQFPTLWGLQRTTFYHYTDCSDSYSSLTASSEIVTINDKPYLRFGGLYLREANNQVLIYSATYDKDLVLYDWNLEVGDSLSLLAMDYSDSGSEYPVTVVDYRVVEEYVGNGEWVMDTVPMDKLVVKEISTITLLDGKEYNTWRFNSGFTYVEGIGILSDEYWGGDYFGLIQIEELPTCYYGDLLVCVSKNGKLLYQMDDEKMERLGAECLCEVEKNWSDTWCNQWNILSHGYLGPSDPLVGAHTSIFWLSDNTTNRNGQEYIPLMCSSSMPEVESTSLIGELRFTEDKQVYFNYDNTEYLLYDFDVQVGDTLDIFGGIELYSYSFVEQKTYPHVITKIDTLDDGRLQITSDAIVIFEDGDVGTFEEKQQQIWIEGLGSINGIVHTGINPGIGGNPAIVMLCAYRDDECVYKTDSNDPYWIDYTQLGCVYNEGDFIEGAFPILSGLQRTVCNEYCGETEEDNSSNFTYKQTFDSIFFENDKPYILCNGYLLREEDNKIFLYSQSLNKDIVLYDFTLEVGDLLPTYIKDFDGTMYSDDTLVVTGISSVTLLDGKEYKKWTFDNGMEYVEGIGMYGGRRNGNFFGLIQEVVVPCHTGTHLVCVSKNGKLLYQMDDAEMERLGAECLCDYDRGPRKDNAKNGKIGGRPTPTQWNMLEVETKEMDGTPTILRAETFSYTLENDSIIANNKTFYHLARQSTKDTAITKSFVGALHFGADEDNRVYFLRDGVEYVLYDFTAEPGDTIEIFAGINNYPHDSVYTHVVIGKDTLENGACRMLLEVVFPEETNATATHAEKIWLAGLGSVDGIVHNTATRTSDAHAAPARSAHSSDTQTSVMLCAWREDSCLYTTNHPEYDTFGCVYNQDPTAVENLTSPSSYQKIIHEGTLLILHEGKVYNAIGIQIK